MWEWVRQNLGNINVIVAVFVFLVSLGSLAWSAARYVSQRRAELRNQRFEQYHTLLKDISKGIDADGLLKLVSQRAFIYELRHFPEYGTLTKRLLESLMDEWKEDPDKSAKLRFEIQDTIKALK